MWRLVSLDNLYLKLWSQFSVCAEFWLLKPETTPEEDNFGIVLWKATASQHDLLASSHYHDSPLPLGFPLAIIGPSDCFHTNPC